MPIYIPNDTNITSVETLVESAGLELNILFGKLKKGEMQSRWDIIERVKQRFIPAVETILQKLEEQKRSAESLIYQKLQETQILIGLLGNINSKGIKGELNELKALLRRYYLANKAQGKAEIRLGKGKKIPGFFVEKAKGAMRRYAGIIGCRINVQKRKPEELADIERIRALIEELQTKSSPKVSEELEALLAETIRLLKQDFEDLLKLEIDADIEEALKLQKIRTLILMLQRLNIKEPIPKLRELESKCRIWVQQDQRTGVKLDILAGKLEEQSTNLIAMNAIGQVNFKMVVSHDDPDFEQWFVKLYQTMPEYEKHHDAFETRDELIEGMHEGQWFLIVAKIGSTVVGGAYFSYYLVGRGKYAIGHPGYSAIAKSYQRFNIGSKLAQLSEYYLRKVAKQKGYRLIMIVRYIPTRLRMPEGIHDRVTARYLKKLKAKRATGLPEIVPGHEPYIRLLAEWKKRRDIPKNLWIDFMWLFIKDQIGNKRVEEDEDYIKTVAGLKYVSYVSLEEP